MQTTPTYSIHTTADDFRFNDETITLPRHVFAVLANHLAQYQSYADAMRADGRGLTMSSPFSPETMACIVNTVLIEARNRKGIDCVCCGTPKYDAAYVSLPSGHVSHVACREGVR